MVTGSNKPNLEGDCRRRLSGVAAHTSLPQQPSDDGTATKASGLPAYPFRFKPDRKVGRARTHIGMVKSVGPLPYFSACMQRTEGSFTAPRTVSLTRREAGF